MIVYKMGLAFLILWLTACANPTDTDNQVGASGAPQPPADPRTKISPYVFKADDQATYPKLAIQLGESWVRLQPTREAAAFLVAEKAECDYVESAEASDRSTTTEIVIFVDCRNGERMYIAESDLKTAANKAFQSQKVVDRESAIQACSNAAKSLTAQPQLADMHTWIGASFNSNKTTGNAQVLLDFEASNALGVEEEFTARCVFPGNGSPPEITLHPRRD